MSDATRLKPSELLLRRGLRLEYLTISGVEAWHGEAHGSRGDERDRGAALTRRPYVGASQIYYDRVSKSSSRTKESRL
jgi:hypothetical protein